MSSSAMLRPGVAIGRYPQRPDVRDTLLDRMAARTIGAFRQLVGKRGGGFQKFVAEVEKHAEGLDKLADGELRMRISVLRRKLYSEGLKDEYVAECFGLVREVATRRLHMRHYDVQLFGGRVMLEGMVAEMETGEGKTMTATLPAVTAALAGIPVHVVTVNDFLVNRDAR